MQSPAFFHLFCWSFHGFCHSFWWFWSFFAIILFAIILNLFFLDLQKKQHFNSMPTVFPIVLSRYHCFFLNFWRILLFFGLRSHLFHPWPCKKSENLRNGEKYNPRPFSICFVCVFALFFPIFWWILRYFFASFSPFFLWPCKKSGNLDFGCRLSSAAECCGVCCWEIQFQAFFHLFCVCFPIVLMDFVLFFGFVLTFFTPDPAKSQETLKLVADWALLSAAGKSISHPFSLFFVCVFLLFCPEFIVSPICLMDFVFFLASFSPFSSLTLEKVRKPWNWLQIEHCWVLLSAAGKSNSHPFSLFFVCVFLLFCPEFILSPIFLMDFVFFLASFSAFSPLTLQKVRKPWNWLQIEHCWVLLSAAGKSNSHPFSISFVCVFPLFCPDFIGFSKLFDGFCIFFGFVLTFFIPDPGKSQETLKLVADWALLSAAECCGVCCWVLLRNPIPSPYSICFVCVCNI